MTFIGGLNQFSAIANLTLIQHLLEKKKKINYVLNTLYLVHIEHEHKDKKVKRNGHLQKSTKEREI